MRASERDLYRLLEDGLNVVHLAYYHTHDSRGSAEGFPDYVIRTRPLMFAELKAEDGKLSRAQAEWLAELARAGEDAYLVIGVEGAELLLRAAIWRAGHAERPAPETRPAVRVMGSGKVHLAAEPSGGVDYIDYRVGTLQSR
jgi:hypothetical protein